MKRLDTFHKCRRAAVIDKYANIMYAAMRYILVHPNTNSTSGRWFSNTNNFMISGYTVLVGVIVVIYG